MWTHLDTLKSWPEFLLPNGFPNARILTFGYDAYVVRKRGPATLDRIRDHATDLLNALARYSAPSGRSLMQRRCPLVQCKLRPCISRTCLQTSSVSPLWVHLMEAAGWRISSTFLSRVRGVINSTNCSLLSVLQTESEVLNSLHDDFLSMIRVRENSGSERSIEIGCFCEALAMPLIGPIAQVNLPLCRAITRSPFMPITKI
jgi:protein SERAC1